MIRALLAIVLWTVGATLFGFACGRILGCVDDREEDHDSRLR